MARIALCRDSHLFCLVWMRGSPDRREKAGEGVLVGEDWPGSDYIVEKVLVTKGIGAIVGGGGRVQSRAQEEVVGLSSGRVLGGGWPH